MTFRREYLRVSALLATVGIAGCGGRSSETETPSVTTETGPRETTSKPDRFDIRDFGAKVDGETNDTEAVQAAIDAAPPGGTVNFPPGTTLVSPPKHHGAAISLDETNATGLTIRGAGPQSVVTLPDDVGSSGLAWIFGMDLSSGAIENLTVEKMTLDGNRSNNPPFTTMGINLYPGGTGHDITIRNVQAQNCSESGFTLQGGYTEVVNCTAINNGGQGFGVKPWVDTDTPEVVLQNVLALNNGKAGIDHNNGYAVVDGFWSENNEEGGAKVPWPTKKSVWRNGTFKSNGTMGFRYNGDYHDQRFRPFTIRLDNVLAVDNPWAGFWLAGDVAYDIGTIAAVGNNLAERQNGNIDVRELARLSADAIFSSDAVGTGLFYNSTRESHVETYHHEGNQAGALSGTSLPKLRIGEECNSSVPALDLPEPVDVGAWDQLL